MVSSSRVMQSREELIFRASVGKGSRLIPRIVSADDTIVPDRCAKILSPATSFDIAQCADPSLNSSDVRGRITDLLITHPARGHHSNER